MTPNLTTSVLRNVGHPWTLEPGWDILIVQTLSSALMDKVLDKFPEKGWEVFLCGPFGTDVDDEDVWRAIFFKPTGRGRGWIDPRPWPER